MQASCCLPLTPLQQPAVHATGRRVRCLQPSTLATLERDKKFISRKEELARVGCVVEDVFTSIAPAPRDVLLLRGVPGLGKSAAAKQGLKEMQDKYAAASCCNGVHVPSIKKRIMNE